MFKSGLPEKSPRRLIKKKKKKITRQVEPCMQRDVVFKRQVTSTQCDWVVKAEKTFVKIHTCLGTNVGAFNSLFNA